MELTRRRMPDVVLRNLRVAPHRRGLPWGSGYGPPQRKQQTASEIDLRHPLEVDPLADSWTIDVPAEKWEQVIERFDDPPAPGEGSANTEAAYERLLRLTFTKPRPIDERDALEPFDCGVEDLNRWLSERALRAHRRGVRARTWL